MSRQSIMWGIKDSWIPFVLRTPAGGAVEFAIVAFGEATYCKGKVFSKTGFAHGTLVMIENSNRNVKFFGWPYFAFWASECGQSGLVSSTDPQIGWCISNEANRMLRTHDGKVMEIDGCKYKLTAV